MASPNRKLANRRTPPPEIPSEFWGEPVQLLAFTNIPSVQLSGILCKIS